LSSRDSTVADLGERALIERIRTRVPPAPPWVTIGIGDDAAVVEPERNELDVLTTDALVEGIHFDRAFVGAADIGFKALAVNVSDLAAMGATPRAALLSLVLPPDTAAADVDALVDGLLAAADQFRVALVGGNVARSPGPLVVDVTATGTVHRRRVLRRDAAKPGDEIYVSGTLGAAAAGLGWLRAVGVGQGFNPASFAARYLRPEPRLRLGTLLGRNRAAAACVDLSDGLGDAVRQIAEASGVGVIVDGNAIPVDSGAREWFEGRGVDPLQAALAGGEDYELLWTVPKRSRGRFRSISRLVRGLRLTRIGVATVDREIVVRGAGGDRPLPEGFAHF
jgi:thiamine-monophosphate kinase